MGSFVLYLVSYAATAVVVLLSLFYLYARHKLSYWSRKGVKSPPAHILFGNLKDILLCRRGANEVLEDIYNSVEPNEPFVGCYIFHKPLLVIRSPDLLKRMMIRDFDVFPNRGFGGVLETDPLGFANLLAIRSPRWTYLRSHMTPCITGKKLRGLFPLVIECSAKLMKYIESEKPDERNLKSFEVKGMAGKFCTDVFASTAFGITTDSFDEDNSGFWNAGQKSVARWKLGVILLTHFFLPELVKLTSLVTKRQGQIFRNIFWDSFNTRERVGNKRGDLIDSLMDLKNGEQDPEFVFDGDNLVGQSVAFFAAGLEATTSTIAFTLYDLSRYPEHEARAHEEITKVVGMDELTFDKLSDLQFLEMCINESLRLHPPLPMNDRISVRDYKIPGTDIILEKGTTIYVATLGSNKDPRFFEDPEKFNPMRNESQGLGFSAGHMSYGIGPRTCIGQRLGLVIAKVALVKILRDYRLIDSATSGSEQSATTVWETLIHGIPLRMQKRA